MYPPPKCIMETVPPLKHGAHPPRSGDDAAGIWRRMPRGIAIVSSTATSACGAREAVRPLYARRTTATRRGSCLPPCFPPAGHPRASAPRLPRFPRSCRRTIERTNPWAAWPNHLGRLGRDPGIGAPNLISSCSGGVTNLERAASRMASSCQSCPGGLITAIALGAMH